MKDQRRGLQNHGQANEIECLLSCKIIIHVAQNVPQNDTQKPLGWVHLLGVGRWGYTNVDPSSVGGDPCATHVLSAGYYILSKTACILTAFQTPS